jgi:ferrous iron transport protein B
MNNHPTYKTLRIALAGNPNAGKTSLFNALTGAHQHVGNWPGKTVAKKEGVFHHQDWEVHVVDLPGTYSLSAYSPEEQIARDYIVRQHPDLVINVVDASNLERNLYLTAQLIEIGAPTLLALNMGDLATRRGYHIDLSLLSRALGGLPVVATIAHRGQGLEELKTTLGRMASQD